MTVLARASSSLPDRPTDRPKSDDLHFARGLVEHVAFPSVRLPTERVTCITFGSLVLSFRHGILQHLGLCGLCTQRLEDAQHT
jgi:hypothetical protein